MEQNQATFFLFFIFVCLLKRICLCLYFYLHFYFSSFHFFLSFFQYVSTLFYFDLMEINIRLFAYHIKKMKETSQNMKSLVIFFLVILI
jgi:hypothetical protein